MTQRATVPSARVDRRPIALVAATWSAAMARAPGAQTAPVSPVAWATAGERRRRAAARRERGVGRGRLGSGAGGTVLRTTDGGRSWVRRVVPGAESLDFRDIDAVSRDTAVVLSIGPGEASRIYRPGRRRDLDRAFPQRRSRGVLRRRGLRRRAPRRRGERAVGGRFVVRLTSDGGRTWSPVPADRLPPALAGEGAFAASGTNVDDGRHGPDLDRHDRGPRAALGDAGRTWSVHPTPVATGEATGIFSIAFRDDRARRRRRRQLPA